MMLVLVMALAIVLLAGAGVVAYITRDPPDERPEVVAAVYDAVRQAGNGGTVDFRRLTRFDWDRMYAFGAYTTDDEVSETLGFPWGTGSVFRLPNDGFILLIFAREARVTGWAVLNDHQATSAVYFDDALLDAPIARDASVFELDGDTNMLRSLSPP
jgi:hypothetical protein